MEKAKMKLVSFSSSDVIATSGGPTEIYRAVRGTPYPGMYYTYLYQEKFNGKEYIETPRVNQPFQSKVYKDTGDGIVGDNDISYTRTDVSIFGSPFKTEDLKDYYYKLTLLDENANKNNNYYTTNKDGKYIWFAVEEYNNSN